MTSLSRVGVVAVVLSLVAACTGDSVDGATTNAPTSVTSASPVALVEAAIGTGVDTQDFQLILDIAVLDPSGEAESFFDDVLTQAGEGRGGPIDLGGGLVFIPTDSLEGRIVDGAGAQVPGAEMGFGLLEFAGTAGMASLPGSWAEGATVDDVAASRALVVFSTTRREAGATHIGFGDQ